MGGSAPTSTPVQVAPPMYPAGFSFANSFYDQVLPQLLNAQYPRFQGSVDPGLSPTMAAVMRGGQTFAAQPFSDQFNQAGHTLGGFQNFNYENPMASTDPNRYGFDYKPDDFRTGMQATPPGMPGSMTQAASMMGGAAPQTGMAPSGPPSGAGAPPGGKAPQGGPRNATGQAAAPFPIEDPTQRDPRAPGSDQPVNQDPLQPIGPHPQRPSPGIDPTGGGGGGVNPGGPTSPEPAPPNSGPQPPPTGTPGGIPKWLIPLLGAIPTGTGSGGGGTFNPLDPNYGKPAPIDLNFGGVQPYQPIQGGQGFVDYNPGSGQINMVRGLQAGSSWGGNPMPPGPIGSPPGTQPGHPGAPPPANGPGPDPNGVVPGNQLEWFGQWRGPNRGKSMDEIRRDMYERGWDYGPNFQKPAGWGERGSKATTWAEARMKNPNAGMGQGPAPAPAPAPPVGPPVSGGPRNVTPYATAGAPAGGK